MQQTTVFLGKMISFPRSTIADHSPSGVASEFRPIVNHTPTADLPSYREETSLY